MRNRQRQNPLDFGRRSRTSKQLSMTSRTVYLAATTIPIITLATDPEQIGPALLTSAGLLVLYRLLRVVVWVRRASWIMRRT